MIKKQIKQIKDFKVIKIWDSAYQAAKLNQFNASLIREVCLGKRKSHKGYQWEYVNEEDAIVYKNWNEKHQKPILCVYSNGNSQIFSSKKEAAQKLNMKESTIYNIVRNKIKQKPNFILKYGLD